ncbi:hypothetical protein [Streptomyces benahoarensis]|uniref:Uncharacterized protein n=1 Tax=Streptomyces benahoarensis TaxID=2595054 RepID=A0A553ZRG1_9ACTN|nr:hypothetical protein [Streptomyces benahoarensis]TSB30411.1 hypothetical protein FNJ62_08130 [Streptomyces benahoarensis]TSB44074.1 hypothetical protein FNZ23_00780 [Streptomyces benahoarensis]
MENTVCRFEGLANHLRGRFPSIPSVGLVAEVLGPVQEGKLMGHRPESGCCLARRPHRAGVAVDDPQRAGLPAMVGSTEENVVAQIGDQLAEFRNLPGDGDAIR